MASPQATQTLDHVQTLRISTPMLKEIKKAAERMNLPDMEVARLSIEIGLNVLAKIDYAAAHAIVQHYFRLARRQKRPAKKKPPRK